MEYVNDDIDELFKKAANDYPLNTDSADWNAVERKLPIENSVPESEPSKRNKYKHLLWLLLLLPFTWMYKYYSSHNGNPVTTSENILDRALHVVPSAKNIYPQPNSTVSPPNHFMVINRGAIGSKPKVKLNSLTLGNTRNNAAAIAFITTSANQLNTKTENEFVQVIKSNDDNIKSRQETPIKSDDLKKATDTLSKNDTTSKSLVALNKKIKIHHGRRLYAGIVISPDVSTVKFQTLKKAGLSMGLVLGYHINKRISIESGIAWDKKYYYSEGKYFSTKRVYANANIKNVDGVCKMIEIPFLLKYHFISKGKTNFSAAAGWASYFMKNENYKFTVEYSGQSYQHSAVYQNSSSNFFAVANFNIGYNRFLKKNLILRIEPYLKIPVNGLGMGSLPVTSTGLNIGITKTFFR